MRPSPRTLPASGAATVLVAALSSLLLLAAPAARAADPTLPAHPKTLLATLPPAPAGWKLTRSTGTILDAAWIITNAERHYQKVALAEGEDPQNPPRTEFSILDTGEYLAYLDRFVGFKPDEKNAPAVDGVRKILIGSYPAFVEELGADGLRINLLARSRYLLTLWLHGQPPTVIGAWLESADFKALAAIPSDPVEVPPTELTLISIDELNPENNSSYTTTVATGAAINQLTLKEQDLERKAAGKGNP